MSNCLSFSHTKQETRTHIISLGCRLDAQSCHGHFCGRYVVVVFTREHRLWECGCRALLYASKSFDAPLRHHRATRGIQIGRTFGWDCFKTNTLRTTRNDWDSCSIVFNRFFLEGFCNKHVPFFLLHMCGALGAQITVALSTFRYSFFLLNQLQPHTYLQVYD